MFEEKKGIAALHPDAQKAWVEGKVEQNQTAAKMYRDLDTASRKRIAELEKGLKKAAERHHNLSDDPVHCRNTFAECPEYACVKARETLNGKEPK